MLALKTTRTLALDIRIFDEGRRQHARLSWRDMGPVSSASQVTGGRQGSQIRLFMRNVAVTNLVFGSTVEAIVPPHRFGNFMGNRRCVGMKRIDENVSF